MASKKQLHQLRKGYKYSGLLANSAKITPWTVMIWVSVVLLVLCCSVYIISVNSADAIEEYYSLGFYQAWIGGLSSINSALPFSVAEILLVLFAVYVIGFFVLLVRKITKERDSKLLLLGKFLVVLVFTASVIWTLFTMGCMPNYYRYTFTHYSGLVVEPTTQAELEAVCAELVEQANAQRVGLDEDENGVAIMPTNFDDLATAANIGYQNLIEQNPEWAEIFSLATTSRAKPIMLSVALSYAQINGFYFGYTGEANVNSHTVDTDIPASIAHELAHVAGFMREDEANFIGYIATRASDDQFMQYSGTLSALVHATNALYGQDIDSHAAIMSGLSDEVRADLAADAAHYAKYDTSFGDFSRSVNDVYLKANNQTDGVKSYGRMVDLLIADYNARMAK